jgi:hypothetical protein
MAFSEPPASAAWLHTGARTGFESVFLRSDGPGYRIDGHTAAVEDGRAWALRYTIELDEAWRTRTARAWGRSSDGESEVHLAVDRTGRWQVNGLPAPELDGCLDVDLEASACTNTLPVHRMQIGAGQSVDAPAVYVRALGLGVERLEQRYARVDGGGPHQRYDYRAPAFDYACRLVYDEAGLILDYPGIASRVL